MSMPSDLFVSVLSRGARVVARAILDETRRAEAEAQARADAAAEAEALAAAEARADKWRRLTERIRGALAAQGPMTRDDLMASVGARRQDVRIALANLQLERQVATYREGGKAYVVATATAVT